MPEHFLTSMPSKRLLVRSSILVGSFSLLGSATGILVDTGIAAKLGLSQSSDAFYVAYTVPYLITNLVSAGAQFSLVPFFAALEARHSSDELWRGFSFVINVIFLGFGAIAAVGAALSPWLVRGIAPGFTHPQTELAMHLGRWLFLMIVPACLAEGCRSFLLSQHRFALASCAGFFRNATVIASIVFTFHRYGLYSIVWGYVAGHCLALVILGTQILITFPVRYSLTLKGSGQAFRTLRGSGTAQVAVSLLWQGVVVVERIIASFLPPGTLTALNWGLKIISTLAEVLAGSIGTAALPALSRAVVRHDEVEERRTFQHAFEMGLALVSLAAVFCLMLSRNIIQLVFQRGNFTAAAASLMSEVFFYYGLTVLLYSCLRILTFYLFARQEAAIYVRLSALEYALMVTFDLLYVGVLRLGAKGIPLGLLTALALTLGAAYWRNVAGLQQTLDRQLGLFAAKNLAGCALAALVVVVLGAILKAPLRGLQNLIYLCELCGAGSLAFVGMLTALCALRISQFSRLWQRTEGS
jgi:putative peptidoglycan lipid II flippase